MSIQKEKATSSFVWVFLGTAGQNLLQFAALMVLARLLVPSDFGIVSAAMIIIGLIGIFSELGVGPAIVQKLELTKEDVGTGKVISASIGLMMGVAVFLSADIFERFMRIEGLADVVKLLAFVLPVSGLTVIGQSLLQRSMQFKKYILCIFMSFFISQLLVAIPLAFLGFGYYALIIATLAQNLVLLLMVSYLTRQYGSWTFNVNSAKHLANYGFGQSLGKFANYLAGQGDNFIIGRYLGASSLGIYGRSYQLMMVPTNLIGTVLDKVMFPMMAIIQKDDKKLAEMYVLSMSIIAMLSVPIIAFIFTASEDIILLLLGSQWIDTAPILKILISVLFFRISYKVSDALSRAKGSVYKRAWRQSVYAASVLLGSYLGYPYGLDGVAYGVAISIVFNYLLMLQLGHSLIRFRYKDILLVLFKNSILLAVVVTTLLQIHALLIGMSYVYVFFILGVLSVLLSLILYALAKNFFKKEIGFMLSLKPTRVKSV